MDSSLAKLDYFIDLIREKAENDASEMMSSYEERAQTEFNTVIESTDNKLKVELERAKKEVDKRLKISEAQERNNVGLQILAAQQEAIHEALKQTLQRLIEFADGPEYPDLLKRLIAEGLISLCESRVRIMVRKKDLEIAKEVLPGAIALFNEKHPDITVKVTIDETRFLPAPPHCAGGVILLCQKGKIRVSNVLNDRLKLAYEGTLPQIRRIIKSTPE